MKSAIGVILPLTLLLALFIGCDEDEGVNGNGNGPSLTPISGIVSGTLTLEDSPYLVTDTLLVPQGQVLTIESGVVLRFNGLYWLKVEGELQAVGTSTDPIVFTSNSSRPTFGDWRNIIFLNPDVQSCMSYCIVEYGALYDTTMPYYNYRGGVACVNSSPIIDHTVIYRVGYNGIYMSEGASPTVTNNVIIENDDNGIFCEPDCNPVIEYNNVWNNHSRDFVDCPEGVDSLVQVNVNLDSCDAFYNFALDPMFLEEGDFHFHSCSPCINGGDPDFTGDPDGTTTDMGAFYYHVATNEIRKQVDGVLEIGNSPYRVTCDAFVLPGMSLEIPAGVQIRFEGQYGITVDGSLVANGTVSDPIVITTNQTDPARGFWTYLDFTKQSSGNSFSYCLIDHGKGIMVDSTDITMDHVVVREMEEYGLYAHRSSPVLTYCEFYGAGMACIEFDTLASDDAQITNCIVNGSEGRGISLTYFCTPIITNCLVYDNGTSGIHCEKQSDPTMVNNTIFGNDYSGVYCFWNSSPVIMNSIITNNGRPGIECQFSSLPVISYNDVWNNNLADTLTINYGDCEPGEGDISADPQFVNSEAGDFHLSTGSPCIDAGNPDAAYNDSDGTRNDMGAFGGPGGNF
jgi:parallel beta-helix repeat protein